jgi:hypothetical protein
MKMRRKNAPVLVRSLPFSALEHDRSGAIAEQNAGPAVVPVEDAGECLRPNDERPFRLSQANEIVGERHSINEARADRLDIESGAPFHAQLCLHPSGCRREGLVRRGRREHDQVQVRTRDARLFESFLACLNRQVRSHLACRRDPAFTDAGTLTYPLVRRLDCLCEFLVTDHPFRQVAAASGNLRPSHSADCSLCWGSGIKREMVQLFLDLLVEALER